MFFYQTEYDEKQSQGYNRRIICSFTNSRKIKMFYSHLSRHTSEPLKKFLKILETRLQSSKKAPKWTNNCKIHDVDKSTLMFGFR